MSQSVIAKRYATALFQAANQTGQATAIQQELNEIVKVFTGKDGLEQLISSPKLPLAKKKELLTQFFAGANQLILNTLFVLLDAKRFDEVANLVNEYNTLANDASGVAEAQVFSTRPLTDEESASISNTFAHKVGKQSLAIENIIDPSLVGGIRLQIGNQIYDSSIRAKLDRLQRELLG